MFQEVRASLEDMEYNQDFQAMPGGEVLKAIPEEIVVLSAIQDG